MNDDDYDHNYFVWLGRVLYAEMKAAQYVMLLFGLILVILAGPISAGIIHQGLHAKRNAESEAERRFYKFRIIAYSLALYAWSLLALGLTFDWFGTYWPAFGGFMFDDAGIGGHNHGVGLSVDFCICFGLFFYFDSKSESYGELSYDERNGYVFVPKWFGD